VLNWVATPIFIIVCMTYVSSAIGFLATKTVVCVAFEDAGSPWGLDTEVRSWSKFSFSLLTSIRRGSEIPTYQNTNGVNSEDHNLHICVGAFVSVP
jgi:hypothetical protein